MRETDPLLPSARDGDEVHQQPNTPDANDALLAASCLDTKEPSWKQRVRAFFVEFGAVGLAVHTVLSLTILALVFVCVSNGVDVSGVLAAVGVADNAEGSAAHSAGSFVIAFAIFKLLAPLRVPLTIAVTPLVMRALRKRGLMLPPPLETQLQSPPSSRSSDALSAHIV